MEAARTSTPVVSAASSSAPGDIDNTMTGQEGALLQEKIAAMQIQFGHSASGDVSPPPAPTPLTLSLRKNSNTSIPVEEEPNSPTSPSGGYLSLTRHDDRKVHKNRPRGSYTSRAIDAVQSIEDYEPVCFDALKSYSLDPYALYVQQTIEYAETALQYHNDDPSNEVKYELIRATVSNYMLEGNASYAHVNFTARAKQEGSEEQLFFAELCFRGDTTVTCFRCLKEKEDQVGGLTDMDTEGRGLDLKHCYACEDTLKHPGAGESYHGGHWMGRLIL